MSENHFVMIDKYIAELLKTNTRVIVPDFGAFMVKASSGSTEKQVTFNDFLKYNDGLLINHIAKKESIVKEEAQKKVKAFVEEIQKELKANKPFKVADLGYLYKDPRGSVRFKMGDTKPGDEKEPDKSQAAKSTQAKTSVTLDEKDKAAPQKKPEEKVEKKTEPVSKKEPAKAPEGKTLNEKLSDKKDTKTQVKSGSPESKKPTGTAPQSKPGGTKVPPGKKPATAQKPKKSSNSSVIIITAAIVVVIGAGAVIAYLNWDPLKDWFQTSILGEEETKEVVVDSAAIKAKQARMDSLKRVQARKDSIEQARQDSIQKAEEIKKQKAQKKYYLVAGSFKNKKYADMFVEKLNNEGYNSEVFMERRGFYRVSYNSYVERQKAFNEYRRMKNQDIQVWVLRH